MTPLWLIPTRVAQWLSGQEAYRRRTLLGLGSSQWGLMALEAAREDIGQGETVRNNVSPYLDRIRRGGPTGAWCAAAVSQWLETAWARRHGAESWAEVPEPWRRRCPVRRSHGARRLFRRVVAAGKQVDAPAAGDIACWARGRKAWQGHVGIVSRVEGERWFYVAGNEGPFPAVVAEHEGTGKPRLIGWARLP